MFIPKIKPITLKRFSQLQSQRNTTEYRLWKKTALDRCSRCCEYPSCGNTDKLEVHHIRPFSSHKHLRTQLFNCIVLCEKHHKLVTGQESKYEMFFFNIIKNKYYKDKEKDKSE